MFYYIIDTNRVGKRIPRPERTWEMPSVSALSAAGVVVPSLHCNTGRAVRMLGSVRTYYIY